MPSNKVKQLRQEVENLEDITVIAIENLETELAEYSSENNIDLKPIEVYSLTDDGLSHDIHRVL